MSSLSSPVCLREVYDSRRLAPDNKRRAQKKLDRTTNPARNILRSRLEKLFLSWVHADRADPWTPRRSLGMHLILKRRGSRPCWPRAGRIKTWLSSQLGACLLGKRIEHTQALVGLLQREPVTSHDRRGLTSYGRLAPDYPGRSARRPRRPCLVPSRSWESDSRDERGRPASSLWESTLFDWIPCEM